MKKLLIPLLVIFLTGLSCKQDHPKKVETATISFTKEGELRLFKAGTDSLRAKLDIEIAETDYETQTGLMYRKSMETHQGMLFIFPGEARHAFYMKNTEFPLDIIFIDAQHKIASFQKNAHPMDETSLPSGVPVQYVLEINAGLSDQWGLQVGDSLAYTRH